MLFGPASCCFREMYMNAGPERMSASAAWTGIAIVSSGAGLMLLDFLAWMVR